MKRAGITLIELIIVLAIVAIIGAILVPNILDATDKARLKSDIQSARVIQSAMEMYRAEHGGSLKGSVDDIIKILSDSGYLKTSEVLIQTQGAKWENVNNNIVVNIGFPGNESVVKAYEQLSEQEKKYVKGAD